MSDGNNQQGNAYQGNAPMRDRHAIGDFRLDLIGEVQPGGQKPPRLKVYYHRNRVSIDVRTNVQTDMDGKDRGMIRAEMDPSVFMTFVSILRKVARDPSNSERPEQLRLKRPDFRKVNNGDPVLDARLVVGKTKDGVVYISVLSWNKERPAIQFPFQPDNFLEFVHGDGSPWDKGEASVALVEGYCTMWENLIPQYMITRYKQEEFKGRGGNPGQGQNRSGGGGYNQNQGGGQQDMRTESRPNTNDGGNWDDLPF